MTHDELWKLESARRKALREITRFLPGDSEAADVLAIVDELDDKELSGESFTDKPLELNEVRDSVPIQPHQCGIDIVLEMNPPAMERALSPGEHRINAPPRSSICWRLGEVSAPVGI